MGALSVTMLATSLSDIAPMEVLKSRHGYSVAMLGHLLS